MNFEKQLFQKIFLLQSSKQKVMIYLFIKDHFGRNNYESTLFENSCNYMSAFFSLKTREMKFKTLLNSQPRCFFYEL